MVRGFLRLHHRHYGTLVSWPPSPGPCPPAYTLPHCLAPFVPPCTRQLPSSSKTFLPRTLMSSTTPRGHTLVKRIKSRIYCVVPIKLRISQLSNNILRYYSWVHKKLNYHIYKVQITVIIHTVHFPNKMHVQLFFLLTSFIFWKSF